jgi:peptidoglycan hydrolase-like protein with peptidoglycan-binding domain
VKKGAPRPAGTGGTGTSGGGAAAAGGATKLPTVDLSRLVQAARTDPGAKQGHQTYAAGVRLVEAALVKVGLLGKTYAGDGSFGSVTVSAYAAWQRRLNYSGSAADGIPGKASLTKLGQRTGLFTVVA